MSGAFQHGRGRPALERAPSRALLGSALRRDPRGNRAFRAASNPAFAFLQETRAAMPDAKSRGTLALSWACQLGAAAILGQTLFFKFTAAEESRFIFESLHVEPWGRIASGMAELACVVLLLVPRTAVLGALLSLGVISGALLAHLLVLGIDVQGDGGLLFGLAVAVFVLALVVAWIRRADVPIFGCKLGRVG
jgi:putative oxidoreductase